VIVEFYGIPRQRAGRAEVTVSSGTIAEVLAAVEKLCPGLSGLVRQSGIATHYRVSVNGQRFVTSLQEEIRPDERILILSADVGG
jgi:hypothetical protein